MPTKCKEIMIQLIDGSEATKTLVDVVYICLLDLSDYKQEALTELVRKCRNDEHKLWGPTLQELVQMNLVVDRNDKSGKYIKPEDYIEPVVRNHIMPIVLTMMEGQTENFKPVHPAPEKK